VAINNSSLRPFSFSLVQADSKVLLELMNGSEQTLRSIEILTVFLKDEETPGGGPSQAHIKFETIKCIQAGESLVFPHRTWINGKPVDGALDRLEQLTIMEGEPMPYVLQISWQDVEGKSHFQRIPVGH